MKSKKNHLWEYIYEKFNKSVSELNSLYKHPGIIGRENEEVLIKFLRSFLPGKYELTQSKVLLDRDGKESTEQDIIIWNSINYPRIFSGTEYFLIENVSMCIEVKTTLANENLKETLLKIRDLRRMNFFKRLDGDPQWQVHPPLCFIFAYDTIWKKFGSILNNITKIVNENDIKPNERFDYLYIMRKGITLNWDIPYKVQGIVDFSQKYGGKIPYNPRWPQFFPSKLIQDSLLTLHENQMWQKEGFREGFFNDLKIENQIKGIISFLNKLCQALEDQRLLHSHSLVVFSFPDMKISSGGRTSQHPF
ncbi:hypothetical protein LCGC14_1260390 [marine sediment metagenome]|uniref:DUF6602 domain-containing protein n=1 Tax=marine sediment metagenome TaxID=412755 RepID=A0A0F9NHM0_9ZZZZ